MELNIPYNIHTIYIYTYQPNNQHAQIGISKHGINPLNVFKCIV